MRRRRSIDVLVLSLLFLLPFVSVAAAQPSFPAPPPPGQSVVDGAGAISGPDRAAIDRIAAALLAERRYPIAVVTIRSLAAQGAGAYTIERYAAELLRSWPPERNLPSHGMLLVVATDDRTARIQLGSAWGPEHGERSRKVMDQIVVPAFKKGQVSAGIVGGVRGFDAMGRQRGLSTVGQPSWVPSALVMRGLDEPWWMPPATVLGALLVLVGMVSVARGGRRSWGWAAGAFVVGLVMARLLGRGEASEADSGATGRW